MGGTPGRGGGDLRGVRPAALPHLRSGSGAVAAAAAIRRVLPVARRPHPARLDSLADRVTAGLAVAPAEASASASVLRSDLRRCGAAGLGLRADHRPDGPVRGERAGGEHDAGRSLVGHHAGRLPCCAFAPVRRPSGVDAAQRCADVFHRGQPGLADDLVRGLRARDLHRGGGRPGGPGSGHRGVDVDQLGREPHHRRVLAAPAPADSDRLRSSPAA